MARFEPSATNEDDGVARATLRTREAAIGQRWPFPKGRAPFARLLRCCGAHVPRGHASLLAPCIRDKIGSAKFKRSGSQTTKKIRGTSQRNATHLIMKRIVTDTIDCHFENQSPAFLPQNPVSLWFLPECPLMNVIFRR